jgi:hypothetical protein
MRNKIANIVVTVGLGIAALASSAPMIFMIG